MHKSLPSIEILMSRKASVRNLPHMFKIRVKGIDGGYKLSELLSGRGGSADAVVNVTAVKLRKNSERIQPVCFVSPLYSLVA